MNINCVGYSILNDIYSIMRKEQDTNEKSQNRKAKPPYQAAPYDQLVEFKFIIPRQFLLLCKLMGTTPKELVRDFGATLSCGSWRREGTEEARRHLINYFIALGYGQQYYTEEEIRLMFAELDALGSLFPMDGSVGLVRKYAAWRDAYHAYWFEKWQSKAGRRVQ